MSSYSDDIIVSPPQTGKTGKLVHVSTRFMLTDFEEDPNWEFPEDEVLRSPTIDLLRAKSDAMKEEAKKHAHDGTVADKLLRGAQIYYEASKSDHLALSEAKYLCFSIRRHFRGPDRVERDVYETRDQYSISDNDAGVLFVKNLSKDQFAFAVWNNIDFVYRVVLYDGLLILADQEDLEAAKQIRNHFCIGFLEELPDELIGRREAGDFLLLQFEHDASDGVGALDVSFEFYVMEEAPDYCYDDDILEEKEELPGLMKVSSEGPTNFKAKSLSLENTFSLPNVTMLTEEDRSHLISQHPARQCSVDAEQEHRRSASHTFDGTVTVVRIDTFMNDAKESVEKVVEEKKVQENFPVSPETDSFYQDSEVSSPSRLRASSSGVKERSKQNPCVVM